MKNRYQRLAAGLAFSALSLSLPLFADAAFVSGDIYYEPFDESTCAVVEHPNEGTYFGDIVIPEKVVNPEDNKEYTVIAIEEYAFYDCAGMTSIALPSTIKSIGMRAFNYCAGLEQITLPKDLKSLAKMVFSNSYNLKNIFVEEGCKSYISHDGILYSKDGKTLVAVPECRQHVDVVEGTEEIGYAAFYNNQIESVTLPPSIHTIDIGGFQQCTMLESIELPDACESIGAWGFDNCKILSEIKPGQNLKLIDSAAFQLCLSLPEFIAPDALETIGESAFLACESMTNAYLGTSLKKIDHSAFETCDMLRKIQIAAATPPELGETVFSEDQYRDTDLFVPDASYDLYADTEGWREFMKMQPNSQNSVASTADLQALRFTTSGGRLIAAGDGELMLFSTDGMLIAQGRDQLDVMPGEGVYILRSGAEVRKVRL